MRPIYFDILIVLIVLLSALMGRKKGFILTLCGFLALFVALIGAGILTNFLAPPLSRLAVPFVEAHLTELAGSLSADAGGAVHASLDQVLTLMEGSEVLGALKDSVVHAVEDGLLEAAEDAVPAVVAYVAEQLTRLVLFPIFFLLLMLVWTALSHMLDLAFHLPGLNFLNRTAGLLLGLARGVLLVFILCWLLKDSFLSPEVISGSFLLPYFCGGNPLLDISMLNS